jgi:hypothetical protein
MGTLERLWSTRHAILQSFDFLLCSRQFVAHFIAVVFGPARPASVSFPCTAVVRIAVGRAHCALSSKFHTVVVLFPNLRELRSELLHKSRGQRKFLFEIRHRANFEARTETGSFDLGRIQLLAYVLKLVGEIDSAAALCQKLIEKFLGLRRLLG